MSLCLRRGGKREPTYWESQHIEKTKLIWRIAFLVLIVASLGGCVLANNEPIISSTLCYGGLPLGVTDEVLVNTGYIVGYSDTREDPLWVSYRVFAVSNLASDPRPSRFKTDMRTVAQVSHDDYTNSGYDRGHMAPNATIDYCYGQEAQLETFYMSNVCPQTPTLNRGIWKKLEETIRDWANAFDEVWVFTGPIFDDDVEKLASGVEIPDAFYKIVIDEDNGFPRVLSFVIPQEVPSGADLVAYLTSVDEVEEMTGFDFLSNIPHFTDTIEEAMECEIPTELWSTDEPPPPTPALFEIYSVNAVAECITLHNKGTKSADLGGWTISDGEGSYSFPEGTIIQGEATYTVCMQTYNPTHYTRGLYLNNKHDQVYLYDPDGVLCDEWTW